MGMKVPSEKDKAGRRSKRYNDEDAKDANSATANSANGSPKKEQTQTDGKNSFSKELARLQFFGAGPKMAGLPNTPEKSKDKRGPKHGVEYDPVS